MKFDLDEQQRAFQGAVTDFLSEACPVSRALAPHENVEQDIKIWRGLMQLGLGGIVVPEEYGGLGLGLLDLAVVAEPLGRRAAPGPFMEHAIATLAIVLAGTEEQRNRWLPSLASGEKRATVAFSEGDAIWGADQWTLEASNKLNGTKHFVLHPEGADLIVVGLSGGRLALVEPGHAIEITLTPSTDGGKRLATLSFRDAACELLEGAAGSRAVDAGLVLLSADAFGGASQCVAMAVEYSKEREQFGQLIGSFQAVKHQLADMALAVEPTIGLYWYAAHAFDTQDAKAAAEAAALAKSHITELYPQVARRMIEAHGGIGYTWEFGAHVWLKRALFDQAYLGMPRVHRARVAALSEW